MDSAVALIGALTGFLLAVAALVTAVSNARAKQKQQPAKRRR